MRIRKTILLTLLLLLKYSCFSQNRRMDSLNALLKITAADTTRLDIFMALGKTCNKKDKLLYASPALTLIDKLLLKPHTEEEREMLLGKERDLLSFVVAYYSNNNTTEWSRILEFNDARLRSLEMNGSEKRTAEFLLQIAGMYLDGKKDSALFFSNMQRSLVIFTKLRDSSQVRYAYEFLCAFHRSAGNFDKAFESIQSSIAFCRKHNYSTGLASSLLQLADLYRDFGEYDQAMANYQAALDIAKKSGDITQLYNVLAAIGGFYLKQHNNNKALEYYNRLIVLCAAQDHRYQKTGLVYEWIGMTYSDQGDYSNALLNFEKSLRLFDSADNHYETATVLNEIGLIYAKQKDFSKAMTFHSRVVSMADSNHFSNMKPVWQYSLALDYFGNGDYARAKGINEQALVDFRKQWFDLEIPAKMELLAMQIDSAMGNGMSALVHYKEYISLSEKLKGDEIRKEAQKERFRNEQEKQKSEQAKKDAIAKRTRNLQYGAIAAFLLLGIFLAYGYVQKNKDKKKIEKAYAELKSTQSQLIQSEKMASLGELTAGIAHEIQNPLNFVNNFSEVSKELIAEMVEEVDKGNTGEVKAIANDLVQNLEKINHHGKRADAIVKGMLQHSRSSSGIKELTDINALCDEYLRLAYHGLRAKDKSFNATMKTDFDASIGNINIIPQDMGRVILNLITNAFYVVDEKKKQNPPGYEPTVTVSTKKEKDTVEVKVEDNGNGIPQKVLDKIFQPFFTTKPTGQGTGLGLSMSYDIVTKGHGGELKVETREGMGSVFIIILPIV
ncbi:MAG: tetratricopeptide repeat protein [Ferruginibacter sp.]